MSSRLMRIKRGVSLALMALMPGSVFASSHQDAPLIVFDPAANTTDVYAFVDMDGQEKSLVVALGVYPFEEPGVGPNKWNFDDNILYQIHIATGDDLRRGRATFSYQFQFNTRFKNRNTILQSYLGVVQNVDDANQNLTQTYRVTKVEHRRGNRRTFLGRGIVPPNNQGNATPFYNQGDNGENPAKDGVASEAQLDRYTAQSIFELRRGYKVFAGQRDDGFFGDIQAIFDLLTLRNPGQDAQGGFNLHLMALEIPVSELGGDQQIVGVYATTSRQRVKVIRDDKVRVIRDDKVRLLSGNDNDDDDDDDRGRGRDDDGNFVQVGRQGNPLFNEGLVAIRDKDRYSRTRPTVDNEIFRQYAMRPELATLLNLLVFEPDLPGIDMNRGDIAAIFIPDLIKVDLSTGAARLAGGGPSHPTNPDDPGFSRLSIFGGDVLISQVQPGFTQLGPGVIPGGWPNGRRFGDDVVDIAVTALASDLRNPAALIIRGPFGDNVNQNDMVFNKVFPYESTPQNGRIHGHHGFPPPTP